MYTTDTTDDCDLDRCLAALACRARRRVVRELVDSPEETFELTDLARESDSNVHLATEALHHRHLPKLDQADLIDWDRRTGTVTTGPLFEDVRPLVEAVVTSDDCLAGPV